MHLRNYMQPLRSDQAPSRTSSKTLKSLLARSGSIRSVFPRIPHCLFCEERNFLFIRKVAQRFLRASISQNFHAFGGLLLSVVLVLPLARYEIFKGPPLGCTAGVILSGFALRICVKGIHRNLENPHRNGALYARIGWALSAGAFWLYGIKLWMRLPLS